MPRSFVRVSVVLILPFLAGAVLAAEGRTPVFASGTFLGVDGKYIVTRNLPGVAAPTITIGASNVDLDLNGFLLTGGAGSPVISVAAGVDHVTIRNGVLFAGTVGIEALGPTRKVDIEDVKIHDPGAQGIHLGNVEGAALRRNEITDTGSEGIAWDGGGFVKHGTIEHNLLRRTNAGIVVNNCSSVAILNNRVEEPGFGGPGGAFPGNGIVLVTCGASLVSENTVQRARANGIFLASSRGNKLFDNVVAQCDGNGIYIDAGSSNTLILNNVASNNGMGLLPTGGEGLLVEGTQNLIERNVLNSNAGFGLRFCSVAFSCSNTFGRNMARGNGGAALAPCGACAGIPLLFPPNSCNIAGCAVPNSTYGDNLIPGPPIF